MKAAYIEPGSPWENGYCESFNSRLRDELLIGESFYSLAKARVVVEIRSRHYDTQRPHSSSRYRPPGPEVVQWPASPSRPASPATPAFAKTGCPLKPNLDHPRGTGQLGGVVRSVMEVLKSRLRCTLNI